MSDPEIPDVNDLQQALVAKLLQDKRLTNTAVETAFRTIPRHLFLPDKPIEIAYQDDAIATKFDDHGRAISSSSQPAMMAIMLEQLALQPGQNVLEIGAGTGYNAALMGHLVGEHGRVTTIDIDQDIVEAARSHLAAAKCQNVTVICGDGMAGYAANAPYDRIILTVGGWEIAPAWLEQLKADGRLLLPLSLKGPQFSIAFAWQDGRLVSHSVRDCGFMRLRGPQAGPYTALPVGPDDNVLIGFEEDAAQANLVSGENIYDWLNDTYEEVVTGIQVTAREAWRSLMLWLALHERRFVDISLKGELIASQKAPYLFGVDGQLPWRMTMGLLHETGLAVVVRPFGHQPDPRPSSAELVSFELYVRCYGDGETAVAQLLAHLHNWDEAGRPHSENMQVEVYPRNVPISEGIAIPRRWHTFVVQQN